MVIQICLVIGQSKNRWSWFSSLCPQRRHPVVIGAKRRSWVPNLCLTTNQSLKETLGIKLGNHTRLCQKTAGRALLSAFQAKDVEKQPEGEGDHCNLSVWELLGLGEARIASFKVIRYREFATGRAQSSFRMMDETMAYLGSPESLIILSTKLEMMGWYLRRGAPLFWAMPNTSWVRNLSN